MFLELNDPDGVPQRIHVPGRSALVGRSRECDLVIDREFVSKQHLRIYEGLVAIDISTNGVYLDGVRIAGGALVEGRPLQIGRSAVTLQVQGEGAGSATAPTPQPFDDGELQRLRAEVESLRAQAAAVSNAAASVPNVELMQLREVVGQLKNQNAALKTRVAAAESELQAAKAVPAAPTEPADKSAASMLVFKLQRENAELKKQLAAASSSASPAASTPPAAVPPPASAPPPSAQPQAPSSTVERAFPGIVPPAKDSLVPPVAGSVQAAGGAGSSIPTPGAAFAPGLARLSRLADFDIDSTPTETHGAVQDFLLVEGYRVLRQFERVITRVAGGLIQLYQLHTMVPGTQGTLREFLSTVLNNPSDTDPREALLNYQRELGRWLVVALGAYREAATKFAESLGEELTPEALLGEGKLAKKKSDKQDAELWRRARQRLTLLQAGSVQERLDEFAREAAQRLSAQPESGTF